MPRSSLAFIIFKSSFRTTENSELNSIYHILHSTIKSYIEFRVTSLKDKGLTVFLMRRR